MLRKIISLFILFWTVQFLLISCCRKRTCNTNISKIILIAQSQQNYTPQGGIIEILGFDSLRFQAKYDFDNSLCQAKPFSLVSQAYAFQPCIPLVQIQDRIKTIKMITLRNYNATYKKGDDIMAILKHKINETPTSSTLSMNECISTINTHFSSDKIEALGGLGIDHILLLQEKPAMSNDTLELEYIVEFVDGKILKSTLDKVVVQF